MVDMLDSKVSSNSTSLRKVTLQGDIKAQHGVGRKESHARGWKDLRPGGDGGWPAVIRISGFQSCIWQVMVISRLLAVCLILGSCSHCLSPGFVFWEVGRIVLGRTRAGFLGVYPEQPHSVPHLEGCRAWFDVLKFVITLK